MAKALTYVEIDLFYCEHAYGESPCAAALGVTGDKKCFNTERTCQDILNFSRGTLTLRFAKPTDYLPADIPAIPSLKSVDISPVTISLGEDLGQRGTLTCTFEDHLHSDVGLDKNYVDRGFDPYRSGTFWGKFRSRFPYVSRRPIRVYRGYLGQTLEQMRVQHFVIEKFEGPTTRGMYTITAKDTLKLADNAKAQAPAVSNGSLFAAITSGATSLVLNPVGIGNVEYDGDGYIAVAGKEIMQFGREVGQDAPVVLMLHCNGVNNSNVFTDDGPNGHVPTPIGGAVISTTAFKFATASASFLAASAHLTLDGSADFDFAEDDFTIEFQLRTPAFGARQVVFDMTPSGGGTDDYLTIVVLATGFLAVEVNGRQIVDTDATLVINTFYHVMVSKRSNRLYLFLNGVNQGAVYDDLSVYGTGPSRPVFGTRGVDTGGDFFSGYLDEIRIVKGRGLKTLNFTAPTVAYTTGTGDTVSLVARALFGTTAIAHAAQDRVQLCLDFLQTDPAIIFLTLFGKYAGVDREFMPADRWLLETATFLQRQYTALIAEPTGVNALASELIEQTNLAIFWDDTAQEIKLQALQAVAETAPRLSPENVIERSFSSNEQPDSRLSQVWTYYGQINPLKGVKEPDNYRSAVASLELQLESFYGSPAIRKIFSRWIPALGRAIALEVGDFLLVRYKDPPRLFKFELQRDGGVTPTLGGGYSLTGPFLQDDEGKEAIVPVRVRRLNLADGKYQIEAEEVLGGAIAGDPNNRVVIIDTAANNVNLRTLHDSIYPEIENPEGITLTLIVEPGVKVGSTNAVNPALTIGTFPDGLPIAIINKGRIGGKGGNGQGSDGQASGSGANGQAGGTAIYTRLPVTVDNSIGEIWGGGGSGGTSRTSYQSGSICFNVNAVGAGGGGVNPGTTGSIYVAAAATTEVGGAARTSSQFGTTVTGGKGGDPGQAGSSGSFVPSGACAAFGFNWSPGAAGNAIDGVSYCTFVGSAGSRKGPEIN